MKNLRDELYEWHLKLAVAFAELDAQQRQALQAWRDGGDCRPDWAWPGWPGIIGPRPRLQPRLLRFPQEKAS